MSRDIFISYSSRDRDPAFAVHHALTENGISAFIAEENLQGGTGWAGELVEEIRNSKAVLLLFSSHSNDSPQVLREIQAAVKYRVPIMPVRIDGTEPTRDMEYFLGTTHWHDAREQPFANRLPTVVARTQDLLRGERNPWRLVQRYTDRRLAIGLGAAALLLTVFSLVRGPFGLFSSMPDPMKNLHGVWELTKGPVMPPAGSTSCYVRINGSTWSSGGACPTAWTGGGAFQAGEGAAAAAAYGQKGDGWFFAHGIQTNISGVWRRSFFGGKLALVEQSGNEWSFSSADEDDFPDPSKHVLAQAGHDWPLSNLPAIAAKALQVVRRDWQADAVLVALRIRSEGGLGNIGTTAGNRSLEFDFISPRKQAQMTFTPYSTFGVFGAERRYSGREHSTALPADFLDLPAAIAADSANSTFANELEQAELKVWWRTTAGNVRLNGLAWLLRWPEGNSAVPALAR